MEIPVMAAATETLIRPRAAVRQVREAPTRPREIPIRENYFDPDEDEDEDGISPKLEKFMTIGSIIIGLIILCIFLALVGNAAGLFNFKGNKTKLNQTTTEVSTETETGSETESDNLQQVTEEANTPVTVPSLTGKTEKEALEALNALSIGGVKSGEQPLQIMRQARSSPRPRQKEPLWRKIPRFTMW